MSSFVKFTVCVCIYIYVCVYIGISHVVALCFIELHRYCILKEPEDGAELLQVHDKT